MSEVSVQKPKSINCKPELAAAVNECIELLGDLDKDKSFEFCASYCAEFVARTLGICYRREVHRCLDMATLIVMLIAASIKLANVLMENSASEAETPSLAQKSPCLRSSHPATKAQDPIPSRPGAI